ncbi:hypothetical protein KJ713_02415 [Patescibacteria group bacterium]|nr:hypothetical protein [Patescibacteria group bacterium]
MITEKQLDKRLKNQTKELKRHFDVAVESFKDEVQIIAEGWKMTKDKVDATFEMVGEIKKDIEIMKSDISFIKNELKQKVDRDEFVVLEKRLILLENKFKRV